MRKDRRKRKHRIQTHSDDARAVAQSLCARWRELCATYLPVIPDGTTWREVATGETLRMGMCGTFQARNGATAVAAARLLREAGVQIPDYAIAAGLPLSIRRPGRRLPPPASWPLPRISSTP